MAALSLRNTPGGLQKGYGLRNKNQWPDWILLRKNTFSYKTTKIATSETSCLVYNKKNVSYPHERGDWGKHFSPQPHPPGIGSARVGRAPRGHRGDSTSSSGKAKGPLWPNGAAVFLIKIQPEPTSGAPRPTGLMEIWDFIEFYRSILSQPISLHVF